MLTSSAELSHCEQRAQSLFTNQLSSAPGLRESSLWGGKSLPLKLCTFFFFFSPHQGSPTHPPLSNTPSFICISSKCNVASGCYGSCPGGGCVVIPGNVIFILSHKSARQEPTQPPTWKERAADAHRLLQLATHGWAEVMALISQHWDGFQGRKCILLHLTLTF